MFDAEKLLGKVVQEFIGTGGKKKGKQSLLGSLSSGAGLMTAIGLGIGAYEILSEKNNGATGQSPHMPPPPPPEAQPYPGAMPPPVPTTATSQPPPTPQPPANNRVKEEVAIRLIQVMIAAAHADGTMDAEEEEKILARASKAGLSAEEKQFLLTELYHPKTIDELTSNITDPAIAKALYMAAVASIAIDTPEEREWLDRLATQLGLSKTAQAFIEEGQ